MRIFKSIFDIRNLTLFILIGIFSLLVDSSYLKKQNLIKELNILKIISYFYIVFGIIMFIVIKKI
jgi:hypothetical protein